ncbi:hypothetical protein BKA65DRAFT_102540 [Rhexocercosporidium sp. MPI-PUGE-AT-0058]|nr:hypothetical protein BKA65DRAFT_102540 [Rhexocercosporidium sp. MPI-PUGE-AT-0058]
MDRNSAGRRDEYEQHELEHAPMMHSSDEVPISEHDDFDHKPPPTSKNQTSRWSILARSLILVPPIAISLAILALNFRSVFWALPTDRTNTILGALQFAAQVHASLLVASISMMVLNMIQHGLASKKGVPLGMISANFYVDSPTWLFRTEFTSLSLKYTLVFPLIVLLAVSSAPSSAIVMIPRLQYWTMSNVWVGKGNMDFNVYIQRSQDNLYPETLSAEFSPPQCSGTKASITPECPSYSIRQFIMENKLFQTSDSINMTMREDGWNRYLVGSANAINQGSNTSFATSSLSTFLGNAMLAYDRVLSGFRPQKIGIYEGKGTIQGEKGQLRARYDLSFESAGKNIPTRKPFVETQCQGFPANSTSFVLPHDRMRMSPWNSEPIYSTQWSVPTTTYSGLSTDLNSTIVNSSFIGSEQFGAIKPSLGAIFATPEILHGLTSFIDSPLPWSYFVCTFDARWVQTQTYLVMASPEQTVYDSFPDPPGKFVATDEDPGDVQATPAYINESWANLLNMPLIDSISNPIPTNRTILDTIGQKCVDERTFLNATFTLGRQNFTDGKLHRISHDSIAITSCLQVSLSVYLADALARAHNSVPIYIDLEGRVDNPYRKDVWPKDVSVSQSIYEDPQLLDSTEDFARWHANLTAADFKDTKRFTQIRMKMSRYGYGYGFEDSILIYVGVVVLLLHAALSVVYIIWVVVMAKHAGNDDRTVGKLLAMGMQSGALGSSGNSVALDGDKKSVKKMWKTRYGLKLLGSEPEEGSDPRGNTEKTRAAILERI